MSLQPLPFSADIFLLTAIKMNFVLLTMAERPRNRRTSAVMVAGKATNVSKKFHPVGDLVSNLSCSIGVMGVPWLERLPMAAIKVMKVTPISTCVVEGVTNLISRLLGPGW